MPKHTPLGPDCRLYLIDGSAYIFRAFHALPPLTRKSDGVPIGAVSGFCNMLWKLLSDVNDAAQEHIGSPTHFAVIFDAKGDTFRNELYDAYKANRGEPPEDLVPQFPLIREATRAFGLPCIEQSGFEADDIMATHARLAEEAGAETVIVSSDKDLTQLVTDLTVMFDPMKNKIIDRDAVIEKFGAPPEKMIDMQALMGDSTDNVPGVPGIGPKTAAQLLEEFGTLDELLSRTDEIKQKKRREMLETHAADARLSRELVRLDRNVPVPDDPADFGVTDFDHEKLIAFLESMEFSTLTNRVRQAKGIEAPAAPTSVAPKTDTPAIDKSEYETVFEPERLAEILADARETGIIAVDTETTGLDAMRARLVGVCLSTHPGHGAYVPLTHGAEGLDLDDADVARQMELDVALDLLAPVLKDPAVLKVGQNIKYDAMILSHYDVQITPIDDTMLLSYVADCGVHGHGMDELAKLHLDHTCIAFKDIAGTGKKQKTFDQIPIKDATAYAAEDADITLRLHAITKAAVQDARLTRVYETMDRPLVPVIVDMERAGIKVDRQRLSQLSGEFAQRMAGHEAAAHDAAGEAFNLGSPKQIGDILFGKLGLPGGKKTKTGAWSTDADVLDGLAAEGHPVAMEILNWRQLSKLKGTYTDALVNAIHPDTGRVHTSFSLANTTTGRLSSNDPNLQNIPIRTEDGRKIRTAFIAEKGNVLISADYSQIELRLLAHIAGIEALQHAFREGIDIHAMTASEVFGVPVEGMDPSVRRSAKAINFGIIYGISAFGLARQLGISRGEASDYIKSYFEKFPGIHQYMEDTKAAAKADGYVETLFGRRSHTPNITAKNGAMRSFAERQAINAPIQGSAADVVRRAMIRVPPALAKAGLQARMLLQVHDELVLECPKEEAEATCDLLKTVMRDAPLPAVSLSVPLEVEAGFGENWGEAH
ncbi:DNA polymerase I [Parvularcula sp. LCG005]|uniref:DNA polymerase I n=1 Tax=Parvularcula sp. LCG005 TaxID=3078805 RepID=UPI002943AC53|nr:DNA polymerase I [Parvularcula sp. LCG005]WOI53323.1 DNA polymerase I [Parvularcula sp. LCG005]